MFKCATIFHSMANLELKQNNNKKLLRQIPAKLQNRAECKEALLAITKSKVKSKDEANFLELIGYYILIQIA